MANWKHTFCNLLRGSLVICLATLLPACSDEKFSDEQDKTPKTARILVRTRASAAETASPYEQKEYEISTLRIYVFDSNNKLVGYHYGDYSSSPQTFADITIKIPAGILTFFTIANENAAGDLKKDNVDSYTLPGPVDGSEADINAIGSQISTDILQSITFSKLPEAEYVSGGDISIKDETGRIYASPHLPMWGKHTMQVLASTTVNLSLTRSVAKMKLYFTTSGTGECYIGRGLYLYNEPQYGYIFPRDTYDGVIDRREDTPGNQPSDWKENQYYSDSFLNQLNGRILLKAGWPEEPESYDEVQDVWLLDINRVTASINNPNNPQYDNIPQKSFFLFANHNRITSTPTVTQDKPEGDGYYLKILVHTHGLGQNAIELHKGKKFYLSMPSVQANDRISVYSVVKLDGFVSLTPHWFINEWETGGGEIEFN